MISPDVLLRFKSLLDAFERLPRRRVTQTFMEVAGFPHYENVCSNILAFYLDPQQGHGLGDLMLRAFLACLGLPYDAAIERASVEREVQTKKGRIDLIVQTPGFVLCIENKIWAEVYNDLADYAATARRVGTDAEIPQGAVHCIVLSLRSLAGMDLHHLQAHGFRNVTYRELIAEARALLGHYAFEADTRFLTYLTDFMQSIENLQGAPTDKVEASFFYQHGEQIEKLANAYWKFRNARIPALRTLIDLRLMDRLPNEIYKQYIWQKHTLVNQFRALGEHAEKGLSIDSYSTASGWSISLFARLHESSKFTDECNAFFSRVGEQILPILGTEYQWGDDHSLSRDFPVETTEVAIADELERVIRTVLSVLGYDTAKLMGDRSV